jgi:hypothetical protein
MRTKPVSEELVSIAAFALLVAFGIFVLMVG